MFKWLGLVVILNLVQIDHSARIVRRDQENEEGDEEDALDIDKNLFKLFLSRTKQFKLKDSRSFGLSIRVKTKNLEKFLANGKETQKSNDENKNPVHDNSFSRIT